MRATLTAVVLVLAFAASMPRVEAQTNCTYVGNSVYCYGPNGQSTSCTRVGNQMFCN